MTLRRGTYLREPDGATLLYYSPLTTWNDAAAGFRNWRDPDHQVGSLHQWTRVTSETEITQLEQYIGHWLSPGEYVEVHDGAT